MIRRFRCLICRESSRAPQAERAEAEKLSPWPDRRTLSWYPRAYIDAIMVVVVVTQVVAAAVVVVVVIIIVMISTLLKFENFIFRWF